VITSLLVEAESRHLDILQLLRCTSKQGQNVFHIAAACKHQYVITTLLSLIQKGQLNTPQGHQFKRAITVHDIAPLVVVLDSCRQSAVGLAVGMPDGNTCRVLMLVLLSWHSQGRRVSTADFYGCDMLNNVNLHPDDTALQCADRLRDAAQSGNVSMVRGLLTAYDQLQKSGAWSAPLTGNHEPNPQLLSPLTHAMAFPSTAEASSNWSPLYHAIHCSDQGKGYACVQLLLSPVVAACDVLTGDDRTSLLEATVFRYHQGGRAGGRTALHLAAMRGDRKVVDVLLGLLFQQRLEECILAECQDAFGYNAWHYAAASGSVEVVETMFVWRHDMMFQESARGGTGSTPEEMLQQPASSWWLKNNTVYTEIASASTSCINALLVGASVAASGTYSAAVAPPAWFQADVDPPSWLTAECPAGQKPMPNTTVLAGVLSWLGLAERLQSVMEGKECDPSAAARKQLARAFISLNVASFFFSVVCIVIGVLMLLPQQIMLSRAQAESQLRWLLWAMMCLLCAVLAQAGAMSVVLYAGWKLGDVHDSLFTLHWWWLGLALVAIFVLFAIFRAWRTVKMARPLHLSGWFLVWSTGSSTTWRTVRDVAAKAVNWAFRVCCTCWYPSSRSKPRTGCWQFASCGIWQRCKGKILPPEGQSECYGV
jgi:hypothetical protein